MKSIIYTVIFLVALSTKGQSKLSEEKLNAIEEYLVLAESAGYNGQILLAQNDEVLINKSIGYTSDYSKTKINNETVFGIASVTKQFTAAAIGKLVQDGVLKFNENIGKILDNVPSDKKSITIHHLLTHSSGITGMDIIRDYEDISKEELLNKILRSEIEFKPGEKWRYSNAGYNLLAFVIEEKTGKTYEQFLNEHFFEPLKMTNTGIIGGKIDKTKGNCAKAQRGFKVTGSVCDGKYNMRTLGGGNIYSAASDLYTWNLALKENKVLNKNTTEKLFAQQYPISKNESYGYGWFNYHSETGGNIIEHGGDTYMGYNGCIYNYLDHAITLIMLNNKFDNIASDLWMRWAIFYPIRDILFKEKQTIELPEVASLSNIPFEPGLFQGKKGIVKIEKRKNQFLITTFDANTSSEIIPIKDSLSDNQKIVYQKTTKLLESLMVNKTEGYNSALEEAASDYGQMYIDEWNSILDENGKLLDFQILAVLPDYFDETIKSYVQLFFEKGTKHISYRFLKNGNGRLSGSNPDDTFKISKWFYGNNDSLVNYDLWNKNSVAIKVLDQNRIQIGSSVYTKIKESI